MQCNSYMQAYETVDQGARIFYHHPAGAPIPDPPLPPPDGVYPLPVLRDNTVAVLGVHSSREARLALYQGLRLTHLGLDAARRARFEYIVPPATPEPYED